MEAYAKNLKEIAENIPIINLQDSLIRLANMSPEQRADIARELKKAELLAAAAKDSDDDEEVETRNGIRTINCVRKYCIFNECEVLYIKYWKCRYLCLTNGTMRLFWS